MNKSVKKKTKGSYIFFNRYRVKVILFENWNVEKYTIKLETLIFAMKKIEWAYIRFINFLQLTKYVLNN